MAGAGGVSLRQPPAVVGAARSEACCTGRVREFGADSAAVDLVFLSFCRFSLFRFWCRISLPRCVKWSLLIIVFEARGFLDVSRLCFKPGSKWQ
jgi:hypothetical protein